MSTSIRLGLYVVVLLASLFASPMLSLPPLPDGAEPFDAHAALSRLERLLDEQTPHPVDSDAGDALRDRLLAELERLGVAADVRDDFGCTDHGALRCGRTRNVVVTLGGSGEGGVLVNSHYDSQRAGPGAADDGIGVAVALQLMATLASQAALTRPVVFLFNEGEEAGLLGARAFLRRDPNARRVTSVINLEARGVRGPVLMFETAHPNAADVAALGRAQRPAANSLMTDIYRLLPNSTDATEFLAAGMGVNNYSMIGGDALYHTPLDDLAHLSARSVQHMGQQALATLQGRLHDADPAQGEVIFADLLTRGLLVLPRAAALPVFLASLLVSVWVWRGAAGRTWRAWAAMPCGVVAAIGLAMAGQWSVAQLHWAGAYWRALPAAAQSVTYLLSVLGAGVALRLLRGDAASRAAGAWGGIAALGVLLAIGLPGASIFLLPACAIQTLGVIASWRWPRSRVIGNAVAALVLSLMLLPLVSLLEDGLLIGPAAPGVALLIALIVLAFAPALAPLTSSRSWPLAAGLLATAAIAMLVAGTATPYAPDAPGHLNLHYRLDADTGAARWQARTADRRLPSALAERGAWRSEPGGFQMDAEPIPLPAPRLDVGQTVERQAHRSIQLVLHAPQADVVRLRWPQGRVVEMDIAGQAHAVQTLSELRCQGRSCRELALRVHVEGAAPVTFELESARDALPDTGQPLHDARGRDWVPVHLGDQTVVSVTRDL